MNKIVSISSSYKVGNVVNIAKYGCCIIKRFVADLGCFHGGRGISQFEVEQVGPLLYQKQIQLLN